MSSKTAKEIEMNKKRTPRIITFGALAVCAVLVQACSSSEPAVRTAKDVDFFLDIHFVGEWQWSKQETIYGYTIFYANGTGVSGELYSDGERSEAWFQWRTASGWILFTYSDEQQESFPYTFSNNYKVVSFEPTRQKGQASDAWKETPILMKGNARLSVRSEVQSVLIP